LDRREGEFLQHKENDDEIDELGNKEGPVHAEGFEESLFGCFCSSFCEDQDHCDEKKFKVG